MKTIAYARAALVERIETRVAVEVAGFKGEYKALARDNVEAAIEELIQAARYDEIERMRTRFNEAHELATHDPKAGGHA